LTLNSDEAKDYLLSHGLNVFNKKIKLRRYDDVLHDEYVEYQHYELMQNKLYVSRQQEQTNDETDDSNHHLRVVDQHRAPVTTPEPP